MVRTLAVTAANEAFVPLLRGLVGSLHQWGARPITDLACFDLGLDKGSRSWIGSEARFVVRPGWDLPVDPGVKKARPELRGLTVRPYLRDYFPGYDVYLWLDADMWIQRKAAIASYVRGAQKKGMAIALQDHAAYLHRPWTIRHRVSDLRTYYGPEGATRLRTAPYFNPGAFAIRNDAPHWKAWEKWFRTGLKRAKGQLVNDQTAINYTIWTEGLDVANLDAGHNWCCHLAMPRFDPSSRRFLEPTPDGKPIGIVHLAATTKGDRSLHFETRGRGPGSAAGY